MNKPKQIIVATPNPNKKQILQKNIVVPTVKPKKVKNIVVANPNASLKNKVLPFALNQFPINNGYSDIKRKLDNNSFSDIKRKLDNNSFMVITTKIDLFLGPSNILENGFGLNTMIPKGTPLLYLCKALVAFKVQGHPLQQMTQFVYVFLAPYGIVIPRYIEQLKFA